MTKSEKMQELQQARPLLKSLVNHFMTSGLLEREDAMQTASMGFLEGLAKYDPQKGSSVRQYAKTWAVYRLQEACNRNLLLHVPLGIAKVILAHYKADEKGIEHYARQYEPGEAVKTAGKQAMLATRFAERLQHPKIAHHQDTGHSDSLECEIAQSLSLWNTTEDQVDSHRLPSLLSRLTRKQQQILYLRFYQEMTLENAGASMGISREAARQLQERGLEILRHQLHISANDTDIHKTARVSR